MRRMMLATAAATALLLTTASAAAAFPENGNGYGKGVIVHCGAPYGQLVKMAPAGHKFVGAKKFITNKALAEAHGCVFVVG